MAYPLRPRHLPRPAWLSRCRQALSVYAALPRLFRLGASVAPGRVGAMLLIYTVYSLLQPAGVWFSKLLVPAPVPAGAGAARRRLRLPRREPAGPARCECQHPTG